MTGTAGIWRICAAAVFLVAASAAFAEDKPSPHPDITPPRSANEHTIKNGYPEMSRKLYEEGVVTLKFTLGVDGKPHDIEIAHSSGYPRLDAAAMDEVGANWLYHPAMRNGQPIAVKLEANVRYSLRDDPAAGEHAVFRMTSEQFPPGAWGKSESGVTTLGVSLKSDGSVSDLQIFESSGYNDLDDAARKVIDPLKFGAATINGQPMASAIVMRVVWPANPDAKAQ